MKVSYSLSLKIEDCPDLYAVADELTKAASTLLVARLKEDEMKIRERLNDLPVVPDPEGWVET